MMSNKPKLHVSQNYLKYECDLYEKYGEEGLRNSHEKYEEYPYVNDSMRNSPEITEEEALKLIKTTFNGDVSDKVLKDLYVTYKVYGTNEFHRKIKSILETGEK